jgi:hypothetical protein
MVRGLLSASSMSIQIQPLVLAPALLFACLLSTESQAAPHARDGIYLQITTGFGLPHSAITVDQSNPPSSTDHWEDSESGGSIGGSLLLGAPLRPGIALGVGGLFSLLSASDPHPTKNGQPYTPVDVKQPLFQFMGVIGPFADIYPSTTLGWHVQALVGYAQVSYAEVTANPFSDGNPSGIGLMAGVGHDWWISEHWSVGLLARVTYANVRLAPTPFGDGLGSTSQHNTLVSPSLEVSFTFH